MLTIDKQKKLTKKLFVTSVSGKVDKVDKVDFYPNSLKRCIEYKSQATSAAQLPRCSATLGG